MPEETKNNSKAWWQRKEVIGPALTVISAGLTQFQPYTTAYKMGVVLGVVVTAFGLKKGYQADNLPSGLSSLLDKVPNAITGVRGENK